MGDRGGAQYWAATPARRRTTVDENDRNADPFAALEDWARKTERRVRRENRRGRLGRWWRRRRERARARDGQVRAVHAVLRITVAIVGLVVLATAVPQVRRWFPVGVPAVGSGPSPSRSSQASQESIPTPTLSDPFAGTPAAAYSRGAAGIVLPEAKVVPGFTAAQVRDSLEQVRKALIASHLDPDMLIRHRVDGFVNLLAPGERADARKWFGSTRFDTVAVWIDPSVSLDEHEQPRVSGTVEYVSQIVGGRQTLKITTNFVWVYAFDRDDPNPLAIAHDQIEWQFSWARQLIAADRGMWLSTSEGYRAWVDCAAARKGLLAPTREGTVTVSTDDQNAYMDADHALDIDDNCGPAPSTT